MMIYFYEKRSETLYNYIEPRPSRSIMNIPFYCSRGYVVFVPYIVYKVGLPGESAYICIVSGVKSMCQQFQFVDSTKMAIQGQSWGVLMTLRVFKLRVKKNISSYFFLNSIFFITFAAKYNMTHS